MIRPTLTIAIPTYNRAEILRNTINHLFKEIDNYNLHDEVELVVSDNASNDHTFDYIQEFKSKNKYRIEYRRNDENLGLIRNIINLVPLSTGKYWMFYGDDDLVPAGVLPELVKVFANTTSPVFMFKQFGLQSSAFGDYDVERVLTISTLANDYFYYVGNAGVFAIRHDLLQLAWEKQGESLLKTCWPQTDLLFVAAALSSEKKITASILETAYTEEGTLVYYNSYYLFETLFFSLLRSAINIENTIGENFSDYAKNSIYGVKFSKEFTHSVIEQFALYDYKDEQLQLIKTLEEFSSQIPKKFYFGYATINRILSQNRMIAIMWLYKQYVIRVVGMKLKLPFYAKLKVLSPFGFADIIKEKRASKKEFYLSKGKAISQNSGYF